MTENVNKKYNSVNYYDIMARLYCRVVLPNENFGKAGKKIAKKCILRLL